MYVVCIAADRATVQSTVDGLQRALPEATIQGIETLDDALDLAAERDITCIVSELDMQVDNDFETYRRFAARYPSIPYIAFVDTISDDETTAAIEAGVTDVLKRGSPNQFELLAAQIRAAGRQYRSERALTERVKELTAIHTVTTILQHDEPTDGHLQRVVDIVPSAFQYPDVTAARIVVDDEQYTSPGFQNTDWSISMPFSTIHEQSCRLDIVYLEPPPEDPWDDPFIPEEYQLAETIAKMLEAFVERRTTITELRRTNQQLELILNNTPAAIYLKDTAGRYLLANERYASLYGVDLEEIPGQTDSEIHPESVAQLIIESDHNILESDTPQEFEWSMERNGSRLDLLTNKTVVHEDGHPYAILGVETDITELKRREAELERQKDRLEEFASVVSHDLRNPLSVAHGYANLTREHYPESAPTVDKINAALDRMAQIIDDLLQLARQGLEIGDREPIDFREVAQAAWNNVQTGEASLEIDGEATVIADRDRVLQLLENLFRNAIEHAGSSVSVRCSVEEDSFVIEDDGPGLPLERRQEIFRPGFTTSKNGTGFGLSIVQSICDGHGWDIAIAEAASGGARFEFRGIEMADI